MDEASLCPVSSSVWDVRTGACRTWDAVGDCLVVLMICWRLLRFRRWGDEVPHIQRFFIYASLLILELTVENFLVWYVLWAFYEWIGNSFRVISAVDRKRMKKLPGLQDNIQIVFNALQKLHPILHRILRFRWVHTIQFLSTSILIALSVLWDQVQSIDCSLLYFQSGPLLWVSHDVKICSDVDCEPCYSYRVLHGDDSPQS